MLEWLQRKAAYRGQVVAFASWDVFPYILNVERSGIPVHAGWDIVDRPNPRREALHEVLRRTSRVWADVLYDAFMFPAALDYLKEKQPRVAYLAFGETDDWAHEGRYDLHLRAAHHFDQSVQQLWETLQAMPAYQDKTTLILGSDHGRGTGPTRWKEHSEKDPESAFTWMAVLGPDTRPLGERANVPTLTQGQFAATAAAFLGADFHAAFPQAAAAITDAVGGR